MIHTIVCFVIQDHKLWPLDSRTSKTSGCLSDKKKKGHGGGFFKSRFTMVETSLSIVSPYRPDPTKMVTK